MIAQVVFDLPIDGPFDYTIPPELEKNIAVGSCVEVTLGIKKHLAIVTAIQQTSQIKSLKPIKSLISDSFVLDDAQMALAREFSSFYGCSLGEALLTIWRGCYDLPHPKPSHKTIMSNSLSLFKVPSGEYGAILTHLLDPLIAKGQKVLLLVPDQFLGDWVKKHLCKQAYQDNLIIATRSAVFRSLKDISLVVMLDEDNPSFKQEQSPRYHARDVLLMRSTLQPVEVAFISTCVSPELMFLVKQGKVKNQQYKAADLVKAQIIDLNNYKFTPKGLLSVPIKDVLQKNLLKGKKTVLILNRKGSFALTRCVDCGFVLKCKRCEIPVVYSRARGLYQCRVCNFHLDQQTICPVCQKPSWKSVGMGIEQLQREVKNAFDKARVLCYGRDQEDSLKEFDILIATQAILRHKQQLKVNSIALIDVDGLLNRLEINSSYQVWSLIHYLRPMASEHLLIQTRNQHHYVIKSIMEDDQDCFYDQDFNLRKELNLPPFMSDISVHLRARNQAALARHSHNLFACFKELGLLAFSPENLSKKRDQYRQMILIKTDDVRAVMAIVRKGLSKLRNNAVISTLHVE